MLKQHSLKIQTQGRGFINLSDEVARLVEQDQIHTGLCHIFLHHTSASLILSENADPSVQYDLETFMCRLIPDGDKVYQHADEGPDDMPSHLRAVLTQSFLMVPITNGKLALGTWQGIYLWEHRLQPHLRRITITIF